MGLVPILVREIKMADICHGPWLIQVLLDEDIDTHIIWRKEDLRTCHLFFKSIYCKMYLQTANRSNKAR